jgi:hypothetical protein
VSSRNAPDSGPASRCWSAGSSWRSAAATSMFEYSWSTSVIAICERIASFAIISPAAFSTVGVSRAW